MDMDYFITQCRNDCWPNILLEQCNYEIGEKLNRLAEKGVLCDVYIMGILSKYNNKIIDYIGYADYYQLIKDICRNMNGMECDCFIIKKHWMNVKHRKNLFDYVMT